MTSSFHTCAREHSATATAEPTMAVAHIQNIAPGPPKWIAVATPAMLPTPTRPPRAIANAWNDETPCCEPPRR